MCTDMNMCAMNVHFVQTVKDNRSWWRMAYTQFSLASSKHRTKQAGAWGRLMYKARTQVMFLLSI